MGRKTYLNKIYVFLFAVAFVLLFSNISYGWPLHIYYGPGCGELCGQSLHGSPLVGDIDGDGKQEIVAVSYSSEYNTAKLWVWREDGTDADGWPWEWGAGAPPGEISLADLNYDGKLEIILPAFGGTIFVWNYNGRFYPGFPLNTGGYTSSLTTPTVVNLDGQGNQEILVTLGDNNGNIRLAAYHSNGQPVDGWPVPIGTNANLGVAVGDIDGVRGLEVIAANEDLVYAFHADGTSVQGWPVSAHSNYYQLPVMGDIDGDGNNEVIVVNKVVNTVTLYAFNGDGSLLPGWPVYLPGDNLGGPAYLSLGDIDMDSKPEIIVAGIGNPSNSVAALNDDGTLVDGWPVSVGGVGDTSPAIIANIDGVGGSEVIVGEGHGSNPVLLYAFHGNGQVVNGWPFELIGHDIYYSPVISDLDKNGDLEVITATAFAWPAEAYVYRLDLSGFPGVARTPFEWPTYRFDAQHTGCYKC